MGLVVSFPFDHPQDHILPLMSDLRFAPDTLFLVAEEDWRLWKSDCSGGAGVSPDDLPTEREGELSAPSDTAGPWSALQTAEDAGADSPAEARTSTKRQQARPGAGPTGWGRPKKAKPEQVEQTSQELCDIMAMCNAAHRAGKGELIWLSWQSNAKSTWTPTHGSTLLGVSARGARVLSNHFAELFQQPWHWDCVLLKAMREPTLQAELAACYLWPSLGGFEDHVSAFKNTKRPEVRVCEWEKYNNVQEGTREQQRQGRAFSRSQAWRKWELKGIPIEPKRPYEVHITDVPVAKAGEVDIWWTGATTVQRSFYELERLTLRPPADPNQDVSSSFQPGTGRSRSKSPTFQEPRKWQKAKAVTEVENAGVDPDRALGEIMISQEQLASEDEISDFKTKSAQRRWRDVAANFERRFFTNDPKKVPGDGNPSLQPGL